MNSFNALFYAVSFAFAFAGILILINKIANIRLQKLNSKYRTYECGFLNPNVQSHKSIKIGYFFIGILFLIFDLEILFLIPWVLHFSVLGWSGVLVGVYFLLVLILGYVYELRLGFINWISSYHSQVETNSKSKVV